MRIVKKEEENKKKKIGKPKIRERSVGNSRWHSFTPGQMCVLVYYCIRINIIILYADLDAHNKYETHGERQRFSSWPRHTLTLIQKKTTKT